MTAKLRREESKGRRASEDESSESPRQPLQSKSMDSIGWHRQRSSPSPSRGRNGRPALWEPRPRFERP